MHSIWDEVQWEMTEEEIEEGARTAKLRQSVSKMPDMGLSESLIYSAYHNDEAISELTEVHLWYGQFAYEYHCLNHSDIVKMLLMKEMQKLEEERFDLINKYGRKLHLINKYN
ncbi:hypothetical protein [Paenibacillus tianjinensis]|uniref:Uncharacterized protein n=1 Tax=Paenibacillus tianjinensis TaxID=2810347 RepID=A0ABX7L7E2_9BACL|nr:hypothetical protein [Paenibacillus tianjinensis]QSF43263.1 hypothetical protein JRJ22_18525 [Paenibacillus tianjinensis]